MKKHINRTQLISLALIRFRKRLKRKKLKKQRKIDEKLGKIPQRSSANSGKVVQIHAPEIFSLSENYDETIKFFNQLRAGVTNKEKMSLCLHEIKDLQPATALVLAAETDRWRRTRESSRRRPYRLRPYRLEDWDETTLSFLYNLGFFDLLEISDEKLESYYPQFQDRIEEAKHKTNQHVALKFVSGTNNDKKQTDTLARNLSNAVEKFNVGDKGGMALCTALAEAALNSVQHAYSKPKKMNCPICDIRWWAASSYTSNDQGDKTIRFMLYDQGVGIPATIQEEKRREIITEFITEKIPFLNPNSQIIKKLLENPKSSTGETNRGKGLPQILSAAKSNQGKFRLISGKGHVTCSEIGEVMSNNDHDDHLGGTLIEWSFQIGAT